MISSLFLGGRKQVNDTFRKLYTEHAYKQTDIHSTERVTIERTPYISKLKNPLYHHRKFLGHKVGSFLFNSKQANENLLYEPFYES